MIHHVKQKLWLNLNANAVDASVHSNVKATLAPLSRHSDLSFSEASMSQNFLPLVTPVSAVLRLRRCLAAASLTRWVSLGARHLPPIITSPCTLRAWLLKLLRGFHLSPRPAMAVLKFPFPLHKLQCHTCCWVYFAVSQPNVSLIWDFFFFLLRKV